MWVLGDTQEFPFKKMGYTYYTDLYSGLKRKKRKRKQIQRLSNLFLILE